MMIHEGQSALVAKSVFQFQATTSSSTNWLVTTKTCWKGFCRDTANPSGQAAVQTPPMGIPWRSENVWLVSINQICESLLASCLLGWNLKRAVLVLVGSQDWSYSVFNHQIIYSFWPQKYPKTVIWIGPFFSTTVQTIHFDVWTLLIPFQATFPKP